MALIWVDPDAAGDASCVVVDGECYQRIGDSDQPPEVSSVDTGDLDTCDVCASCSQTCPPTGGQPSQVAINYAQLAAACHFTTPGGCPVWNVPACGSVVVLDKSDGELQWVGDCCVLNKAYYFIQINLATFTSGSATCCYWWLYAIGGDGESIGVSFWCGYKAGGDTPLGDYLYGVLDPFNACDDQPDNCAASVPTLTVWGVEP